jgi:hypothetical protein
MTTQRETTNLDAFREQAIRRNQRLITAVWARTMAAGLVRRGGKRYCELMDEIRTLTTKYMNGTKKASRK